MLERIAPIISVISAEPDSIRMIWRGTPVRGSELLDAVYNFHAKLATHGISYGTTVLLKADYSLNTTAIFLALIECGAIIIPLVPETLAHNPDMLDICQPDCQIEVSEDDVVEISELTGHKKNEYYEVLIDRKVPGLVLFTSGSTGDPKAVVHDFSKLLRKFETPRSPMVMLNFLMFDHWGGLNTLLHGLATGSLLVLPEKRQPSYICDVLEKFSVELLPTTPTFLNMLLISQAYEDHDLTKLKIISYGAEPMPEATLNSLRKVFPDIELRQTYGMIELGVLRAKSESNDSLWVRIGGEGYDLRVVDGILQIKADSAMLGYINAPSPFTSDGYLITGDRVEVSGEFMKFLGRDSELINVGGQKVFPAEVETVLLQHPDVADVIVFGEKNPIIGSIVSAKIRLASGEEGAEMRGKLKKHCHAALDGFKVPVKITFTDDEFHGGRLKRIRR